MKFSLENRFQDQPWHIKIWRYRWYFRIPYDTLRYYFVNKDKYEDDSLFIAYKLAFGDAQLRMKWYYTLEEVFPNKNFSNTKWYNCAKCDGLYEEQECSCNILQN